MYFHVVPKNDDAVHWGIKEQKWGLRRFQNPDGSLTPEGRIRYSKSKTERRMLKIQAAQDEADAKAKLADTNYRIAKAEHEAKEVMRAEKAAARLSQIQGLQTKYNYKKEQLAIEKQELENEAKRLENEKNKRNLDKKQPTETQPKQQKQQNVFVKNALDGAGQATKSLTNSAMVKVGEWLLKQAGLKLQEAVGSDSVDRKEEKER